MATHRNQQRQQRTEWEFDKSKVRGWIINGFDDDSGNQKGTIHFTETFGRHLAKERLTTTQFRNIFGEIKRIDSQLQHKKTVDNTIHQDFLMLKPKMAYAAKRAGSNGIIALKKVMDEAHAAVRLKEENGISRFGNFTDFLTAILAYHKVAGGRE